MKSCFTELTYSVYVDGELSSLEALAVDQHLASCAACRAAVERLRQEVHVLREALAETGEETAALPALHGSLVRPLMVAAAVAVAAGLAAMRALSGVIAGLASPATEWLDPFRLNAQLSLFFRGLFYLIDQGASMLVLGTAVVSALLVVLLVASGAFLLRRRGASATLAALAALLVAIVAAPDAAALEVRTGRATQSVVVGKDETLNDSLAAAGETVIVEGVITGNLLAGARRVIVRGTVQGDVFASGQSVEIDGAVGGNLVLGGQWLTLRGKVTGSVFSFGQSFRQEAASVVDGDLAAFGADIQLDGKVARDFFTFSESADIRGSVGRHLRSRGDRLKLLAGSSVGGNLTATVRRAQNLVIDAGAKVAGKTETIIDRERARSRFTRLRFYLWEGGQLVAALLIGAALFGLFPGFYRAAAADFRVWLRSAGLGFAVLFASPIAIVILCVTLVGIPAAVALAGLYAAGLYLAKILAAAVIGAALLRRGDTPQDALLSLLVGLLVYYVAVNIPFAVGGIVLFATLCLGLGAFSYRLFRTVRVA
jgi:anti-sigma factor RsiW